MATDPLLSEQLPELYRLALDAVDELARRGQRAEAARLRHTAGRVYSRAWDDDCRRTLEDVIRKARASVGALPAAPPRVAAPPVG